ncbi:CocE/NonD family hydrolase [Armatimonas rosea]|uniref:Xaa-Pro dipeptidyl-peptidase C-terminal domain-containing protein n=1 Tax=Armatimonas rosea TaxID=685828 RepID=A0A7W9SPT2_ARMRO|nr:CocE/NonD family hydrolase [Armatimonas rosea]MBB6049769.1 hypothetical protein [Armatimonas rosea]
MRRTLPLAVLALGLAAVSQHAAAPHAAALRRVEQRYTKRDVQIPMRDGTKLYTVIYTPKDTSEKHPILMERTPYSVPYGADDFGPVEGSYAQENYILVFQDVRGKYLSEGDYENVRPLSPDGKGVDESSDTYDTIDWLVKNVEGNNGKVGMVGVSYPGFYAAVGAVRAHPALKAVSPQAPVTDWFLGDDDHHNGAFMLLDNFAWCFGGFDWPRQGPSKQEFDPKLSYDSNNAYDFYLKLGALKNANERFFHGKIPFWNDLIEHDTYDAFWQARTPLPHFKNMTPAFLVVGGFFDAEDLWGPQHMIRALQAQSPKTPASIVIGPWSHGGWGGDGSRFHDLRFGQDTAATFRDKLELPFFNYYLKGKGTPPDPKVKARVFATGSNQWLAFSAWPPKGLPTRSFYLQPGKGLATAPVSNEKAAADSYVSDPASPVPYTSFPGVRRDSRYMAEDQRFASKRPDVLTYTSAPLTKDMTTVGGIEVELTVATTGTDSDWIVKVIDVSPDTGVQRLVRGDAFRGKFRNSFTKPEPFVPGKPTPVHFALGDICHTFKKGHRLQVQIQSSWFPLVDRNPQKFMSIGKADDSDFVKATQTVFHSKKYPSRIRFTVKP